MNTQPQTDTGGSTAEEQADKEARKLFLAMVGELAHEINNPNNFASLSAQNTEFRLKELKAFIESFFETDVDEEVRKAFDDRFKSLFSQIALVKEGCQRVSGIVVSMREKSRGDVRQKMYVDPAKALVTTVSLVKSAFETMVEFNVRGLLSQGEVHVDSVRLNQLFTNLIVNACHAIEERKKQEPSLVGEIAFYCQPCGAGINISIVDNGCGMSARVKERLFDNFFTTKSSQKGTGLGMGVCKSIVEECGGTLSVESKEGEGTTITLWLPLAK